MTAGHDFVAGAVACETGFQNGDLLQRSCVWSAQKADKVAFSDLPWRRSAEIVCVDHMDCGEGYLFRFADLPARPSASKVAF